MSDRSLSELFSQHVQHALADLDAAQQAQEVNVAALPQETLGVYETKGRLLALIEEMNKVAKLAFWERKDLAAQFNALLYGVQRAGRSTAASTEREARSQQGRDQPRPQEPEAGHGRDRVRLISHSPGSAFPKSYRPASRLAASEER